jgi:surfactin synthase thioesterase subunit
MAWVHVYNEGELRRCKLRMVCFPHAGGGTHSFASWAKHPALLGAAAIAADAASDGEATSTAQLARSLCAVLCIAYPGRGARAREALVTEHGTMVDSIADALVPHLDGPFAFFGHSAGAALAFEVARALAARGLPLPLRVFLSSHKSPAAFAADAPTRAYVDGSDDEFVAAARAQGWFPRAALDDPSLLAVMLPVLRADLRVYASWAPALEGEGAAQLAVACTVIGGADDASVPLPALRGWAAHVAHGSYEERVVADAGHFHPATHEGALLGALAARLDADLRALPRSVVRGPPAAWSDATLCLHTQFENVARARPDRVAFADPFLTLSFAQVSFLYTVTFYANLAHSLTRSP